MSEQKQPLIGSGGYRPSLDDEVDPRYATESYQHQVPTSNAVQSGQPNVVFDAAASLESQSHSIPRQNMMQQPAWQQQPGGSAGIPLTQSYGTSRSWSLSSICAIAWALPPFSSVFVLVWETENDLARFHAYQSGICGVALIILTWFLRSLLGLKTIGLLVGMGAYGWFWVNGYVAFHHCRLRRSLTDFLACRSTAHKSAPSLARNPYLPHVGDIASRWVGEE